MPAAVINLDAPVLIGTRAEILALLRETADSAVVNMRRPTIVVLSPERERLLVHHVAAAVPGLEAQA